ncbi:MAG: shikimate dehydrogenase [bacterium]
MAISAKTRLCAFVAHPAHHTASPAMHNAGYKALDLDYVYLAFDVLDIGKAIEAMRTLNIAGYSVSLPHKVNVMQYLDEIDPVAKKIGAVNTVVNTNGHLKGYNTDWVGCIEGIKEKTSIAGKNVLLIGAGGAARAIAFGINEEGGSLFVLNRDIQKATALVQETGGIAASLDEIGDYLEKTDIIIQSTSVGMDPNTDATLVPPEKIKHTMVVNDIVYKPKTTKLLLDAQKAGATVVYGYKMLLLQGVRQFTLFTGSPAPTSAMEEALLTYLQ